MPGINLKEYVGQGINTIFEQLEQIVEKVRIIETIGDEDNRGAYNPRTGRFEAAEDTPQKNQIVDAIKLDIELNDFNRASSPGIDKSSVEFATSQFLIKEKDITTIKINTYSRVEELDDDGETTTMWRVVESRLDPTKSFYEVFVREAS